MSKISTKNIIEAIDIETKGKTGVDLNNSIKKIITFLHKRRLIGRSKEILEELEKHIDKREGVMRMKVSSADTFPNIKKADLESKMKDKYKVSKIESTYLEDKSLLGGVKIEIGEDIMDMTYRNKLNQLEKHLIKNK